MRDSQRGSVRPATDLGAARLLPDPGNFSEASAMQRMLLP